MRPSEVLCGRIIVNAAAAQRAESGWTSADRGTRRVITPPVRVSWRSNR